MTRLRCLALAALLIALPGAREVEAAPASTLPPDAALHHERGIALIAAGDHRQGAEQLMQAYAAMPDPLRYRKGRGKVLGSLRSTLNHLYATTGEVRHLCRLQTLLREHIAALQLALADDARPEDTAGSQARLDEVDAALVGSTCTPDEPAPVTSHATVAITIPPPHTPPPIPPRDRGRPLRHAGAALLGVGFIGLSGMAGALIVHFDVRHRLQSMTADLALAHRSATPNELADAERLRDRGQLTRGLAIAAGVSGALALICGAVLRAQGVRRTRITPVAGTNHASIHFDLAF